MSEQYGRVVANRWYRGLGDCEVCGRTAATVRHHRDGDTSNNGRDNVDFLCRRCHYRAHHPVAPTHCPAGHAYADHGRVNAQGRTVCKLCQLEASRRSYRKVGRDTRRRRLGSTART